MKYIRIKADLHGITWDTPHKYTTLPKQARVDFKVKYEGTCSNLIAEVICRDLESRYHVRAKGWERWNLEYEVYEVDSQLV